MKLYVTRFTHKGVKRLSWQGTQELAKAKRKDLEQDCEGIDTIEFDVPTDKPGLLAFLNEYVTGELGAKQAAELFRQLKIPQPNNLPASTE